MKERKRQNPPFTWDRIREIEIVLLKHRTTPFGVTNTNTGGDFNIETGDNPDPARLKPETQ